MSADYRKLWETTDARSGSSDKFPPFAMLDKPFQQGYMLSCDPNDCSPGTSVEVSWERLLELRDAINAEEKRRKRK